MPRQMAAGSTICWMGMAKATVAPKKRRISQLAMRLTCECQRMSPAWPGIQQKETPAMKAPRRCEPM